MTDFGLVIHGGAGAIAKRNMPPDLEKEYRAILPEVLLAGYEVLKSGGSSLDAVQKAINVMEDSPLFNAGKGAVFTYKGGHRQDAAIMDGSNLKVGAVAGVQHIKNPIDLARLVMEKSPHILMAQEGAEEFARAHGMELVDDDYFYTERRWKQLEELKAREARRAGMTELSEGNAEDDKKHGTVGAVALDQAGNLAAATSTGGMTGCRFGRIGDTPMIGAGTYANNDTCAVSATGHGEYIIRAMVAYDIATLMEYRGMSVQEAADTVINEKMAKMGGTGGVIAIDREGNFAMPFNTGGMYRGYVRPDGAPVCAIYRE